MKKCLLCNREEPGNTAKGPDVDYVCADCVLVLVQTTQKEIDKKYIQAIGDRAYKTALALYTFTSRKVRREYPLKGKVRAL